MKSANAIQPVAGTRSAKSKETLTTQISLKAYELWEKQGRINGADRAHWLEAERIIKGQTA